MSGISVTLTPSVSQSQLIVTTPLHDATSLVETSTGTFKVMWINLVYWSFSN